MVHTEFFGKVPVRMLSKKELDRLKKWDDIYDTIKEESY